MKLEELLNEETYKIVQAAIDEHNAKETDKLKHIRYADLSEGGYISKEKHASIETSLGSKTKELETANKLIEELKAGTGKDEELQGKITAYETTVKDLQAELAKQKVESAVKLSLLTSGCKDIDYISFKLKENGELELGDDGKVKGIDDRLAELKTKYPTQFKTEEEMKVKPNPLPNDPEDPKGGDTNTLANALAEHYKEE